MSFLPTRVHGATAYPARALPIVSPGLFALAAPAWLAEVVIGPVEIIVSLVTRAMPGTDAPARQAHWTAA